MVSIIILNYNSASYTLNCVESIHRHIPKNLFEIIVVDNNSNDEDKKKLRNELPSDVVWVESRFNAGFGLGNMLGYNMAKGDYLCIINSDILFEEDCISPLCEYLKNHPDVGCITPLQLDFNHKQVESFRHNPGFRRELFGNSFLEKHFPKKYPKRMVKGSEPVVTPQVNGCFMMFPTAVFKTIGGFDTNIFLYDEECDVGYRIKKAGKKCVVLPSAVFLHAGATTTRKRKRLTGRERYISRIYVYRKHHGWVKSFLYRMLLIAFAIFKPKRWYILPVLFRGELLSKSMRSL